MTLVELERQGKFRVPCEVWSRVVGYLRPVSGWNPGKRQEYRERRYFDARPDFGVNRDETQEKSTSPDPG